ncbi:T9SS type B sorting domain-containing protein [Halocola ammonii]
MSTAQVTAQTENLVYNGGFEYYFGLPQNLGDWGNCDGWTNAGSDTSTPDYFHEGGSMAADLPETPVAIVQPYSGKGIMGFTAAKYSEPDFREYITNELTTALQQGEQYKMTFFITNGSVTTSSNCGAGVSKLGVSFTSSAPDQAWNQVLDAQCLFELDTVFYSKEWTEIEFVFTAPSNAQFFTIGVFETDEDIDMDRVENTSANVAYYFVDEFKIERFNPLSAVEDLTDIGRADPPQEDDSELPNDEVYSDDSRFFIPNAFTPDGDGVNEVFKPHSPEMEDYTFEVFDRWGSSIFSNGSANHGWDGRDNNGNFAECGVYIWKLYYEDESEDGKPVLRTLSGTVNLLR